MDGMTMTTTNELEQDLSEAVRSTAILADVTISIWGAERTDPKIMERAKSDAGATGNVGRAIKNLLAGADANYKDTKAAFAAVRALHYGMTLPWVSDPHAERQRGPRLLPNLLFERYATAISAKRREAMQALDKFIDGYDADVAKAKSNLAALADADYPDANEVRRLFRIAVDFEPIPAGTAFRGLPPSFASKLAAGLAKRQEVMVRSSQAAMWEEVRDRIGHLAERMGDADARFKATTIESVRELLVLLPGWNVAGDERAAEVVRDIDRMMANVADADQVRRDVNLRGSVAGQAAGLIDKLAAWGL